MQVKHIKLTDFRNYEHLDLDLKPFTNVFVGNNAQGKTNLLEAVNMFSCVKSHRSSNERDLVFRDKNLFCIELDYLLDDGIEEKLQISWTKSGTNSKGTGRRLFINEVPVTKLSEFIGRFHAVLFAPEDTTLIKDSPKQRRSFLDMMVSQTSAVFLRSLQTYLKLLQQKNALLKDLRESKKQRQPVSTFDAQIDIWDEQLAWHGAEIVYRRKQAVDILSSLASTELLKLTNDKEHLAIELQTHGISNSGIKVSQEEIFKTLYIGLKNSREDDIYRGNTSIGPHRDDLVFSLNGDMIKAYASQGQHRSVILALKLAEMQFIELKTKQKPVLLLDDVMSELDEKRRSSLINAFLDYQVLITCTEQNQVSGTGVLNEAKIDYFEVQEASIKQPMVDYKG